MEGFREMPLAVGENGLEQGGWIGFPSVRARTRAGAMKGGCLLGGEEWLKVPCLN